MSSRRRRDTEDSLPAGNRKEVTRDRDRLMEAIQLIARRRGHGRLPDRQTTGHHRQRRIDVEVNGAFHIRGVLTREDRAGVDGLALRNWTRDQIDDIQCGGQRNPHIYGCFLLEVCAGVNHCSAVHFSVVLTAILESRASVHLVGNPPGKVMLIRRPRRTRSASHPDPVGSSAGSQRAPAEASIPT